MIESIQEIARDFEKVLQFSENRIITIHENQCQHSDFLTVAFMHDRLTKGNPVTFLGVRENYAHFLTLSKKMGKPLDHFFKDQSLTYYECFNHQFCSELPLTDTSPAVFNRPPKHVQTIRQMQIVEMMEKKLKKGTTFIVDAICFLEFNPQLCYAIIQNAIKMKAELILSGCSNQTSVSQILRAQTDLYLKLENDVGGHGKFKIVLTKQQQETSFLYRWINGHFEISKFMKL